MRNGRGARRGAPPSRGLSLLEVVLASALVLAAAIPLVEAVHGLRKGMSGTGRRGTALFLGQAVLEGVRHRLYAFGPRPGKGNAGPVGWQSALDAFFAALAKLHQAALNP